MAAITQEWLKMKEPTQAEGTLKRAKSILSRDVLPFLGSRPIKDIETFELVGCLNRVVDRDAIETAHKCRQLITQIFRYAKQSGRLKHNPASDLVGTIPSKRPKHRAAITEPKAFGKLLVDLDAYAGTHTIRTALRLAPLVFQRPGELCAMEWSEIDLDNALWVIPEHNKCIPTDSVNKALRKCGYDTSNDHCTHGFRPQQPLLNLIG